MSDEDFPGLQRAWVPQIRPTDVIFVRPRWWRITPMFYYLQPERHRIVGYRYAETTRDHPDAEHTAATRGGVRITIYSLRIRRQRRVIESQPRVVRVVREGCVPIESVKELFDL